MKNQNKTILLLNILNTSILAFICTLILSLAHFSAPSYNVENSEMMENSLSQHQSFDNDYKKASNVLRIHALNDKMETEFVGTGFFIADDIILTNAHNVIDGYINAGWLYGAPLKLELIRIDRYIDLAAFRVVDNGYRHNDFIEFCDSDFRIGEAVWSFGFGMPYVHNGSLKTGFKHTSTSQNQFKGAGLRNYTNSIVNIQSEKGDSGSPVLKRSGCFANVINSGITNRSIMTGAVSHHNIKQFLLELELLMEVISNDK